MNSHKYRKISLERKYGGFIKRYYLTIKIYRDFLRNRKMDKTFTENKTVLVHKVTFYYYCQTNDTEIIHTKCSDKVSPIDSYIVDYVCCTN